MSSKLILGVYTYWRHLVNAYGTRVHRLQQLLGGSEFRSIGIGLSRRPPSAGLHVLLFERFDLTVGLFPIKGIIIISVCYTTVYRVV